MAESQSEQLSPAKHFAKVQGFLNQERIFGQLLRGLPPSMSDKQRKDMGDRIRRIILSLAQRPGMHRIPPEQFAITAIRAAEIGLDPEPVLGKLHLLPFNDKLQIVIGYRGWVDLGYRSGMVKEFRAEVVWKEDAFDFATGLRVKLEHIPNMAVEHSPHGPKSKEAPLGIWLDDDLPQFVWAVAELLTGGVIYTVLPRWKVLQYRSRSSGYKNVIKKRAEAQWVSPSVWETDAPAMFTKTALLRLRQVGLPISSDILPALAYDAEIDPSERPKDYVSRATEQVVDIEAELSGEPLPAEEAGPAEPPPTPAQELNTGVGIGDFSADERAKLLTEVKARWGFNVAKTHVWLAEGRFPTVAEALRAAEGTERNEHGKE